MSGINSQTQMQLDVLERLIIWNKGSAIPGWDPAAWRHDFEGYVIRWSDYGDTSSEYGWQKDHIVPDALGGINAVINFRPRHWRRNQGAGSGIAALAAAFGSRGIINR